MRSCRLDGCREGNSLDTRVIAAQQFIGSILDPLSHMSVGRSAIGRVVFETTILRRIVGWSDHDAIGEMIFAIAVVDEDGARDDRRRSYFVIFLDDGFHAVRGQHLERGTLRGSGQRVRVFAHIEWAIRALATTVVADGLGHGDDVGLGKGAMEWRPPMSTGAED